MPLTDFEDLALHVEVHEGTGPHLLLLHGFLSSRAQWRVNLAGLARVCRPVVVELLAHGRSAAPEDETPYRVASYVAAFEHLRQRLGAERWAVCGQSFGAGITWRYALSHPDRVLAQVATNSMSAFQPAGKLGTPAQIAERAAAIAAGGAEAIAALPFHPSNARRFPDAVRDEMVADAALIPAEGLARCMAVTVPGLSVAADVAATRVPSLLVNGLWEKSFQPLRQALPGQLPGVEVVDLEGGHSINVEVADGFNAAVGAFLARHAGGR
ncbi:alpha/beta fold hydrolase [Zavarzinia sp. CC-PAN008]|uniref:alpha/beta fold hydrolase n=1 Tax=Zavarzinia sp. CC-PAN008 TaxID=3243332 RepID=UPI003F747FA3